MIQIVPKVAYPLPPPRYEFVGLSTDRLRPRYSERPPSILTDMSAHMRREYLHALAEAKGQWSKSIGLPHYLKFIILHFTFYLKLPLLNPTFVLALGPSKHTQWLTCASCHCLPPAITPCPPRANSLDNRHDRHHPKS